MKRMYLLTAIVLFSTAIWAAGESQKAGTGIRLFKQGKYTEAVEQFKDIVETPWMKELPAHHAAQVYYYTAFTYYKLKNYPKAIAYFKKTYPLDQKLAQECYFYIGTSYFGLGKMDEAKPAFKKVIELKTHPRLTASAQQYLQKTDALKLKPIYIASVSNKDRRLYAQAVAAFQQEQWEQAIQLLESYVPKDPKNYQAHNLLGNARIRVGKNEEGFKSLKLARDYASDDVKDVYTQDLGNAYFTVGTSMYQTKKYKEALSAFEQAQALTPWYQRQDASRQASTLYYPGFIQYETGKFRQGLMDLQKTARIPSDVQQSARYYSGMSYYNMGLMPRARMELEEAIAIGTNPKITQEAQNMIEKMKAAPTFSGVFSGGANYDTNVINRPEVPATSGDRQEGAGFALGGDFKYGFRDMFIDKLDSLFNFAGSYSGHFDKVHHDQDGFSPSFSTTLTYPFWLGHFGSAADLTHSFTFNMTDGFGARSNTSNSFTLNLNTEFLPIWVADFRPVISWSDYAQDGDLFTDQDGENYSMTVENFLYTFPYDHSVRYNLQINTEFNRSEGKNNKTRAYKVGGGVQTPFFYNSNLSFNLSLQDTVFTKVAGRDDVKQTYTVSISRSFTGELNSSTSFTYVRNGSTLAGNQYEKATVAFNLFYSL